MGNAEGSRQAWRSQAPVPKYYQVKQAMLDRILAGEWEAGDEIPSEQVLEGQYQVSRGTLRRAIDELVQLGLLKRSQGKSTIVSQPRIPIFSKGFRADIQNAGKSATSKILQYGPAFPPADVSRQLELPEGMLASNLVRVISADDEPIILETVYFPQEFGRSIAENDLLHTSLLDLMTDKCGVILKKAMESYEATILQADEAKHLGVKKHDLAIADHAITFDINDQPVFVSKALIRQDRARMVTEVTFHI
jgi:GntR family transcriptional regulator